MNWRPPQQGFLKVNVDAALANTTAAAAMVVRDEHGNVLLLASKLFTCNSAFDAEVEALGWAAGNADGGKWNGKRMQRRLPIFLIQRRILMADEFSLHELPFCILEKNMAGQAATAL
ncbi:hypothetical protein FNV43_RR00171 [Rhamnella rubrinervis]|uniref:RNase H type-1 domain-containing protein n=1 Tax=Rhamnella rubrinervis TaxID=2594499 RepID=A0A8K0MS53_9ROSA|nr:hypothetical protein FNV43_RR00171 [Rhamnella rubrinervis]